jgi:arylsulfatase A-like enzyme
LITRTATPLLIVALLFGFCLFAGAAYGADKKPNILVIWGDDTGQDNISAYHRGLMGGRTPNIDRIAKEGAMMTDAYAQQSCQQPGTKLQTGR